MAGMTLRDQVENGRTRKGNRMLRSDIAALKGLLPCAE